MGKVKCGKQKAVTIRGIHEKTKMTKTEKKAWLREGFTSYSRRDVAEKVFNRGYKKYLKDKGIKNSCG